MAKISKKMSSKSASSMMPKHIKDEKKDLKADKKLMKEDKMMVKKMKKGC